MPEPLQVAIVGAAGDLGKVVFKSLVQTPHINVLVLRKLGSKSVYPPRTNIIDVDYSSVESLAQALQGQHALVSTVGQSGIAGQVQLIDACIIAGVERFISSDFGLDLDHPNAQKLPPFVPKVKIQEYLVDKCKVSKLSYTIIYTGSFIDWGFSNNMSFNVLSDKPTIVGDGNIPFSGVLISTNGEAVVGVLTNLDKTKNRSVFVRDFSTTQNELLAMARRIAPPERHYQPIYKELDALQAEAESGQSAQGPYGMVQAFIYRACFDRDYRDESRPLDNELLGIAKKDVSDLEEAMRLVLARTA